MMTVRDLMTEGPVTITPQNTALEAWDCMRDGDFRHLPVVDSDELVGLVTERDLMRSGAFDDGEPLPMASIRAMLRSYSIEQVMARTVETAEPDDSLSEAGLKMLENKFGCLPIVEGRRLVGILTEADFVRHVAVGPA
jgi:CBS domain-containing membrane protein